MAYLIFNKWVDILNWLLSKCRKLFFYTCIVNSWVISYLWFFKSIPRSDKPHSFKKPFIRASLFPSIAINSLWYMIEKIMRWKDCPHTNLAYFRILRNSFGPTAWYLVSPFPDWIFPFVVINFSLYCEANCLAILKNIHYNMVCNKAYNLLW